MRCFSNAPNLVHWGLIHMYKHSIHAAFCSGTLTAGNRGTLAYLDSGLACRLDWGQVDSDKQSKQSSYEIWTWLAFGKAPG